MLALFALQAAAAIANARADLEALVETRRRECMPVQKQLCQRRRQLLEIGDLSAQSRDPVQTAVGRPRS